MAGQIVQVNLGAAIEHGGDQGNADTAADIAGQIHQPEAALFLSRGRNA